MKPLLDIDDARTFVRRLVLAEILSPTGEPGPLAPPSMRWRRAQTSGAGGSPRDPSQDASPGGTARTEK